jgi:hypothetical protein
VRDDDRVLEIFRQLGHWGAIAKSNYSGLRFREPVYRTLRELAFRISNITTTSTARRRCGPTRAR